ncbi:malate dehydrogenase [candidate division KSB1 bacterium]|nr:malate dehydrogenase [candidate division KSB1 bacterium]
MSVLVDDQKLLNFIQSVFETFGLSQNTARICADNLVMADLRGIPSHGVARLKRYTDGMKNGVIFPLHNPKVVQQTASTATVDANDGLGQVAGHFATRLVVEKAKNTGVGIVTVRNSNHYGIAGYYSNMILQQGLLGISMTNSAPLVVPTFGKEMILGTNPISLAAPTLQNRPFFLDMATSVVPRGKLEVYDREEKSLPQGWAVDDKGKVTTDPGQVLHNMLNRIGGGILPLGGEGELYSGYKGYGMALLVDILCGVLSGGAYADLINAPKNTKPAPARVSHFFMALKIETFVEKKIFQTKLDDLINRLKNSAKAEGEDRIFIHGEKEYERRDHYMKEGIPLQNKVYQTLESIAAERSVQMNIKKSAHD